MIELIMQALFTMSITGTIIAVIILLIKPMVKNHIPKFAQYYSCLIIVIAFIVPFSLLITLPEETGNITTYTVNETVKQYIIPSDTEPVEAVGNNNISEVAANKNADEQATAIKPISILFIVWLMGMGIYLLYNLWAYLSFANKLKRSYITASYDDTSLLTELSNGKRKPSLYKSDNALTPMLIGFFRPAIVLPDKYYSKTELEYILLHELTHFYRHDIIVKWLVVFANAMHWFNPIIYFVRLQIEKMCELSCDEAVIQNLDNNTKQEYGSTLITVAAERRLPKTVLSTTMSEDKKILKERLGSIKDSKKTTKGKIIISVVLIVVVLCAAVIVGASVNEQNDQWAERFPADLAANGFLSSEIVNALPEFSKEKDSEDKPFYYWHDWNESKSDVNHKIEMETQSEVLTRYHYKNYYYDVPQLDSPLSLETASDLVNKFAKEYIPKHEEMSFTNTSSNHTLYDPGHVELWFAMSEELEYTIAVDLDMGSVVYFESNEVDSPTAKIDETNKAFIEPKEAQLDMSRDLGALMPSLDFGNDSFVIFHSFFGLFVYDLENEKISRSYDLSTIGCDGMQGDNSCEVLVSTDGQTIYLHPNGNPNMYVINLSSEFSKSLYEIEYEELQGDSVFHTTYEYPIVRDTDGIAFSDSAVEYKASQGTYYGYLQTTDYTIATLSYVMNDHVYNLFEQ